jgi:transcriptional regulator with XRE-family HTH domain
MPRRASRIQDPGVLEILEEALARGSLPFPDAFRALRAKYGLTQAQFAKLTGVSLKVIKGVENAEGNATLKSLSRIAGFSGLQVRIVKPGAVVRIVSAAEVEQAQARRRHARLRALSRGDTTLERERKRNALRGSDFKIEPGKMT